MKSASAKGYQSSLVEALQNFRCYLDSDVQEFLNRKAIDFEKRGWATTYLLLNKEKLDAGELFVEGYFSLTQKAFVYSDEVSLEKRKKLSGNKEASEDSFVLIGQLGKWMFEDENGTVSASELTADDLLKDAMMIIEQASSFIVNRNVIIECKPIDKVKGKYEKFGFSDLQFNPEESLHTLYLRRKLDINFDLPSEE